MDGPDLRKLAAVQTVLTDLLGAQVEADDDFFAVGGHSLLIVELIGRLRAEHGLAISARQFLVDARIASIAAASNYVADPASSDAS